MGGMHGGMTTGDRDGDCPSAEPESLVSRVIPFGYIHAMGGIRSTRHYAVDHYVQPECGRDQ